jgi:hypothetical protein
MFTFSGFPKEISGDCLAAIVICKSKSPGGSRPSPTISIDRERGKAGCGGGKSVGNSGGFGVLCVFRKDKEFRHENKIDIFDK